MTETNKSLWRKTKTQSKIGFDKLWGYADKLGEPVNRLSHKLGSEAFWPTTLDKESEKAARILKSFCSESDFANVPLQPDLTACRGWLLQRRALSNP